ncbi:CYP3A4 (predicted) [Pycnogonum litorale]
MYLTITVGFVIALITVWIIWRKRRLDLLERCNIPGPKPSSFIWGDFKYYLKVGWIKAQKEIIDKYGKICGFYAGLQPIILVADLDTLKLLQIKEFFHFTDRPSSVNSEYRRDDLIDSRGDRWKFMRRFITPSFSSGKLKKMMSPFNEAIDTMVRRIDDKAEKGEDFDIYQMFQGLTLDVIGRTAFGIQTRSQEDENDILLNVSREIFQRTLANRLLMRIKFAFPEFRRLITLYIEVLRRIYSWMRSDFPLVKLRKSMKKVIAVRKENKQLQYSDLLQLLLDAEVSDRDIAETKDEDLTIDDNGDDAAKVVSDIKPKALSTSTFKLSVNEILDNAFVFLLAGYETTSTALGFTVHLLVNHPEIQEKVQEEINDVIGTDNEELKYDDILKLKYLGQVIDESLRLYPPIGPFVSRLSTDDYHLNNMVIPKGSTVMVPIQYLHHNPEYWDNPEEFNPDR